MDVDSQIVGVEALIRWDHPEHGLVYPKDFIPLAEENGLILSISLWVLETVCKQLKIWENNSKLSKLEIAVNVSCRQFRQSYFVRQIQNIMMKHTINPSLLKLELTENFVLENVEETIEKMKMIQNLGVSFSIDDFGTGLSSLSYLARLPLNQLKIDKCFVDMILQNKEEQMIVKTIITMGIGLGMNIIAEGVETMAQKKSLQDNGCLFYQGNLFSKPVVVEDLERIIL